MALERIIDGVMVDTDAELPILTHIINSHNEGDDVRQTIISFKNAYSGPYHCIVIADETKDGSCDNLDVLLDMKSGCPRCGAKALQCDEMRMVGTGPGPITCAECQWTLDWQPALDGSRDRLVVIRNKKRVGCGKAKEQAQKLADPDSVIIHSDGHCRMMFGDLDMLARIAKQNEVIVAPGVAPLHCPANEQPRMCKHCVKDSECPVRKDPKHPGQCITWKRGPTKWKKNHSTWGGRIVVDALGAKVDACAKPGKKYARREATFWAVFMVSAKTLRDRLGGWNEFPGRWGSQEIGLALRAWFADVPIITTRDIVAGHRYRADQRKDHKPYAPYSVRTSERRANHRYAHQVVFSPTTCKKVWKKNWRELAPSKGAYNKLLASNLTPQGKHFRKHCKRKTDEEFRQLFCADGWPNRLIPLDEITAIVLCYRRPENQQRCIDAIRKEGITNIWAYVNHAEGTEGKAAIPTGCTRIFQDSQNASTWARYVVAPLVATKWILFCDDDLELTPAGIRALRAGGALGIDNAGLIGARFTPPDYNDYHKRKYFKSHKIREAVAVDMLWPKGQLIYRDLAIQLFGEGNKLWQAMRKRVGSTSGDDLISTIAQEQLFPHCEPFGRFAHVVPSVSKGYREHHKEGKKHSLTKQPGRISKKRKTMKIWRDAGWRSVEEHINVLKDFWQPKEEGD